MNWSLQASNLWGESELVEMNAGQAFNALVDNVNALIDVLRMPGEPSRVRSDISKLEQDRVCRLINDSLRGLQHICTEYAIRPELNLPEVESDSECEPDVDGAEVDVGVRFPSLEAATAAFENYASHCGFTICKGNSKRDVYQELACSARGKVRNRKTPDGKKRNRQSIKHMCKCHVILRKDKDEWVITTKNLKHTHPLLNPDEIKKVAKNRYIPENIRLRALDMYRSGETPAKIQYALEAELKEQCTWTMKDLYNMLYRERKEDSSR